MTRYAAAAALIAGTACRPWPTCPFGASPFDGATGVPLDGVVEFRGWRPLPPDLPSLDEDAVSVETMSGEVVPIEVVIDGATVRLIPTEPLQPDTEYVASGVYSTGVSRGHWWGEMPNAGTTTWFSTGGTPTVLAASRLEDPPDVAVIGFTEPVDLDSVAQALVFDAGIEATVLGTDERAPNLVRVRLDKMPEVLRVRLVEGATALDGDPVPPSGGYLRVYRDPEEFVTMYSGEPGVCP